jgi:hypothetical protein
VLERWDPHTVVGANGETWRAAAGADGNVIVEHIGAEDAPAWTRTATDPFGEDGFERPSIAEGGAGEVVVAATKDETMRMAVTRDRGATWEAFS